jgi:collagenase-like PrtC family protease
MPIQLVSYPHSLEQAERLLDFSDYLVLGEDNFGLRLPTSFSRQEQAALVRQIHRAGKKALVAVNGLLHNREIEAFEKDYLPFLRELPLAGLVTGDPGVLKILQDLELGWEIVWDTQTLNTSSGNLNFWAEQGLEPWYLNSNSLRSYKSTAP